MKSKSIKQFLKPTRVKIILLIILISLAISSSVAGGRERIAIIRGGNEINEFKVQIFEGVETVLLLPIPLIGKVIITPETPIETSVSFDLLYPLSFKEGLLMFTMLIFYWHLLSCFLVFVYEKIKKKT